MQIRQMITSFLCTFLLAASLSIQAGFINIDKIDGKVLQDKSGSFQARLLETGSKINQGVIINSQKSSHARLRFFDNSTVVVGPETNIKIESHKEKAATILYLSKGVLRAKIEKDSSTGEGNKFYVLTPTALVAVKGTEFLVHYNPINKKTSLITFKGSVHFAMVDLYKLRQEKLYETKEDDKEVERDDNNNVWISNVGRREVLDDQKIDLALSKYNAVEVGPGQYSGTVGLMKKTSLPTLLSPIQVNILFRNTNLNFISSRKNLNKSELKLKKNKSDIPFDIPKTPATGLIDYANSVYAPKAGGFWDTETGFYIPPGKDSLFLGAAGIFIAENIGDLDKTTGQYIAPVGLQLNPKKGFEKLPLKENAPKELLNRINDDLNRLGPSVHRQIVVGDENESIYTLGILSKRELISKDVINFYWRFVDHTLSMSGDSFTADRDYNSNKSMAYTLEWNHESFRKWQPMMAVTWQNLSYSTSELAGAPQDGERLFKMNLGYRYSLSPNWNVSFIGGLDQLYFLDHGATPSSGSGTETQMTRVTLPRFYLMLNGQLFNWGRWSSDLKVAAMYSLARSPGNLEIDSGFGFNGELSTKYWWTRSWWLGLNLGRYLEKYSVSNQNFTSDAEQKGTTYGLNLGLVL